MTYGPTALHVCTYSNVFVQQTSVTAAACRRGPHNIVCVNKDLSLFTPSEIDPMSSVYRRYYASKSEN